MLIDFVSGQTGVIVRVKIRQSSAGASPGQGLTGLTGASAGLVIATIADAETATTAYTAAGSTIDAVTTLGTYAAPATNHCGFGQVDSVNHPGLYEIQLGNARFAVGGAKSLVVSISGATNMADCDVVIPLRGINPYDSQRGGMAALPSSGTVAISTQIPAHFTNGTFASDGVFAVAALANAPSSGGGATSTQIATAIWQDLITSADFTTPNSIGAFLLNALGAFTAASVSSSGFTLSASDALKTANLAGYTVIPLVATTGAGPPAVIASSNTTTGVQTLVGNAWPGGMPTGVLTYLTVPPATLGTSQPNYTPAMASQIPAHFTNGTFASDGVFAGTALANAPSGGSSGGTITLSSGTVLASPMPSITTFTANGSLNYILSAYTTSQQKIHWETGPNAGLDFTIVADVPGLDGNGNPTKAFTVTPAMPSAPVAGNVFAIA